MTSARPDTALDQFHALMAAMLDGHRPSETSVQRAAEAFSALVLDTIPPPPVMEKLLWEVAAYAAELSWKDRQELLRAGLGEDALFDLTVAAAVGVGWACGAVIPEA